MKIKLNDDETQAVFGMISFMLPVITGIIESIMEEKPFIFSEHVERNYQNADIKQMAFALCLLVRDIEPITRSNKFKEFFRNALDEITKRDMVVMH